LCEILGWRIVAALGMRVLLASLLVLCAVTVLAQPAKSPAPQNPQKTQDNSAQPQVRKAPEEKDISKQSQPAGVTESNVSANYYEDQDKDKGKTKPVSDWLLAIFTLALVVVGVLQWLVLRKHETWMQKNVEMVTKVAGAAADNAKALITQSGIMEKQLASMNGQNAAIESQNRTMQESVAIARDAAEASIEEKRARVKIGVDPLKLAVGTNGITCWIENHGPSPAFITDFRARLLYCLPKEIDPDDTLCKQILYSETILANSRIPNSAFVFVDPTDGVLNEEQIMNFKKGLAFVHFYGFAKYTDIFKRARETRIHMRWFMRWGGTSKGV